MSGLAGAISDFQNPHVATGADVARYACRPRLPRNAAVAVKNDFSKPHCGLEANDVLAK